MVENVVERVALEPCPNPWCEAGEREGDFSPQVQRGHFGNRYVSCTSCNMRGPTGQTEAEAITAWNTRAALSAMPSGDGVREALVSSTESMERTLAAMDRYNEVNGTAIIGPSLLTLGKMIARNRTLLAKLAPPQETTDDR